MRRQKYTQSVRPQHQTCGITYKKNVWKEESLSHIFENNKLNKINAEIIIKEENYI